MNDALSRRFVWGAVVAGPFYLFVAFIAFPYLGRFSYDAFHLACVFSLLTAFVGITAWIVQFFPARRGFDFLSLCLLLASAMGAIAARIYGDWY